MSVQTHIEAKIGDVSGGSQVAVGNYIVQIGRVEGGIVNILNEAPPPPRPRPQPVLLRPKPFAGLLDRQTETTNAVAALQSQQTVECTGESGSGKTSLLRHLAHQSQLATTFPAGVVYFQVNQQSSADLLKSIFDAFYVCDFPIKPNDTEMRHYLQSVQALVLLDDVRVSASEIETLMNVAPNCTFIAVTKARSLFGETVELTLKGLPTEDAILLFKKELGRTLAAEEENGARQICESVGCVPLLVLRAAHEARLKNRSLLEVVSESKLAAGDQQLANSEIKSTSADEKKVLAVLATFAGVAVAGEHVTAIAGVADAKRTLDDLEARGLVQSHENRYSLASDLTTEQLGDTKHWFARSLSHFLLWTEENRNQPTTIAASGEAILSLLKQATDAKLWNEVRRLGHASEEALTVSGKWDMWASVLKKMQAAAQAQGDVAESAWVLHQLGTRALCLGDRSAAEAALRDALGIRERLGDITGAAVTRHNLNLLFVPLPPERNDDNSNGGGGTGSESTPLWLKVGVISLVGLAILTGLLVWFVVNPKPPVKPLKIASFSVSPATIPANGEAQLCYEVENAARVRIEPGVGERESGGKECLSVMPSETQTYTLTAVATNGATTSQQITLTVEAPAPPPEVQIAHFAVERQDGPNGADDLRFRLCYEVHNAAHAEVDNDVGAVVLNRRNCQPITPQQTTTYTLSATGTDGLTVTRQATADATKPPAPRPQILGLKAVPEQVIDDGTSKLCFQLRDAANALIDPGARVVPVSSGEQCVNIKPLKTTTYTLKVFNAEGLEASGNQTITVIRSPKVLDFAVEPRTIARGNSVSLCYRVENASGVSIEPGQPRARSGGGERICVRQQPTATTTYTLTAFNDSGLKSQPRQDTVTVEEPKLKHARILFFSTTSPLIKRGGSVTLCYGVADAQATSISPFRRDFPNLEKHCFDHAPKESTTYILKTTGEDQQAETRELSVTVERTEPAASPVRITRFEINPTVVHGTQICYALENARAARIEPSIGELQNLIRGCPRLPSLERQTYTLIATGADGTTDKKSLTFTPPEPPKPLPISIISFKGPAQPIKPRAEAKLCYRTVGEGKAEILPQPGAVTPSFRNCVSVFPDQTTRYTLNVFGPQGQKDSRTVTVTVERPVIIN